MVNEMIIKAVYVRSARYLNTSIVVGGMYVAKPIDGFNGSYRINVSGIEYIVREIDVGVMAVRSLGIIKAKFEIVRK